jgi:hypothetical protein
MALYVSDSFEMKKGFEPIGFKLFSILSKYFVSEDIISVKRYNGKLLRNNWHTAAVENNYYLRGFNYLFIMHKKGKDIKFDRHGLNVKDRRDKQEVAEELEKRRIVK